MKASRRACRISRRADVRAARVFGRAHTIVRAMSEGGSSLPWGRLSIALPLRAIAALAGSGALSLSETLLLGFLGGLLGDGVSYFLGRHFHQNIRRLPGLRHHPEWMNGAETYFHKYGIASLLVGRFIGPLRPMLPMVAGMCDMPVPRFIIVSLMAGAGWSVAYLLPGWATGAAIRLPLPEGFWPQAAIVAAGLTALLGLSINASIRRQPR